MSRSAEGSLSCLDIIHSQSCARKSTPIRYAPLAEAERQLAAEQVAYDRALAEVRRARAYTQAQLGRALG